MDTTLPMLADAEDLALLLGVPADDPKLKLALSRASGRFRDAVGHEISKKVDDQVVLSGDGGETLLLPAAPVTDVRVMMDGKPVSGIQVDARHGIVRRVGGWPDLLGAIHVTYTHGWEPIPDGIQDAVLEQAQLQYQVLPGVQQAAQGGRSVTFGVQASVGVTQRWAECVARYQLRGDRA